MNYFAEPILDRLVRVQEIHLDLINPEINVYKEFGLVQSFWHRSNLQVQNQHVPTS
jgi:hypothetical protein